MIGHLFKDPNQLNFNSANLTIIMEADTKSTTDSSLNSGSTADKTNATAIWENPDADWGWPDIPGREGIEPQAEHKENRSMWDEMIDFESKSQQIGTDDCGGPDHMDHDDETGPSVTFDHFLDIVEESYIRTNVVLVSFIPESISHEDFTLLMEAIMVKLMGEQAITSAVLRFLRSAQGATYFADQPPRWMELYHADERHASFLLKLDQELTFGPLGAFGDLVLPRAFQISPLARTRNYLVQAVPPDIKSRFLRSPILAVWRGLGNNLQGGFPNVALCLASAYSARVHGERGDLALFHILSYHQSQAQWGGTPVGQGHHPKHGGQEKQQRGKRERKGQQPGQTQKPGKKVWMEYYILTLCSAPAGRIPELFGAYLPAEAHPRTMVAVLNLFGWHCEVGRELKTFRAGLAPDGALLSPLPVTVFPGIPRHTSLRDLCRRLNSDGQDLSSARLAFFQQDTHTKTLYLTDGSTRFQSTAALLQLSSAPTHENADLPGLANVRECYKLMRPSGPLLQRAPGSTPQMAQSRALTRIAHPTYAEIAGRPVAGLEEAVTQINARRDPALLNRASQLIAEHLRPMEQHIQSLQQQVSTVAAQGLRAQQTGEAALGLMVRQERTLNQLRARAEEDRRRYQEDQETAQAFRDDVQATLARLGIQLAGEPPLTIPPVWGGPGSASLPPLPPPAPGVDRPRDPSAPAAAARMDEG